MLSEQMKFVFGLKEKIVDYRLVDVALNALAA